MTIQFNVTGKDRKRLMAAISQILDTPSKYLGAPSMAYQVGDYHIDKEGTVTGPDNRDLIDVLTDAHGFVALVGEYDDMARRLRPSRAGGGHGSPRNGLSYRNRWHYYRIPTRRI